MNTLLKEFSSTFLEKILSFLWQYWSLLGIPGYQKIKTDWIIDPEALLLFSLEMGRYDARLFDEIIDWLFMNSHFLNIQRLTSLQRKYDFCAGPQLSAIAEYLSRNSTYQLKWKKLSHLYKTNKKESFFLFKTGNPIPVGNQLDPVFLDKGFNRNPLQIREHSGLFPQTGIPSLLLRLRALLGINARCELFCVLASMKKIHPAEAARLTGFFQKTVQTALVEMSCSGFVQVYTSVKKKYYQLKPGIFDSLLFPDGKKIRNFKRH